MYIVLTLLHVYLLEQTGHFPVRAYPGAVDFGSEWLAITRPTWLRNIVSDSILPHQCSTENNVSIYTHDVQVILLSYIR